MNTDIAYKGLKYITIWVLIYFVVKYTSSGELSEIDITLVATVLTLLLCILESMYSNNMYSNNNNQQENMKGLTASGDLNVTGSMNSIVDNRKGKVYTNNKISVTGVDGFSSDAASSVSNSSVSSMSTNSNSNSSNASSSLTSNNGPNAIANVLSQLTGTGIVNKNQHASTQMNSNNSSGSTENSGVINSGMIPNPSTSGTPIVFQGDTHHDYQQADYQQAEYINPLRKDSGPIDNLYVDHDYLGQEVLFDKNDFGGTSNQSDDTDSTISSSDTDTEPLSLQPVPNISNSRDRSSGKSDDVSGIIKINVPKPGMGNGSRGYNSDQVATKSKQSQTQPTKPINTSNGSRTDGVFVRVDKAVASDTSSSDSVYDNPDIESRMSPSGKPLKWYEQAFNPRSYAGAENLDQIAVSGGKTRNDLLVNEMIYSDFNRLPPSFNDKDFEYGYSFLPPKDWYPLPPYPPVCVSNRNTPVQPVYLDTMTMDLKEWHETQKITPPDSINTAFVTNELNSKV